MENSLLEAQAEWKGTVDQAGPARVFELVVDAWETMRKTGSDRFGWDLGSLRKKTGAGSSGGGWKREEGEVDIEDLEDGEDGPVIVEM